MKILIIEDEVMIAEILKDYLLSFGYTEIQMAHDKQSGLQLLETFKPQLVLLDVRMEREKDGLEIGQWINQKYQIPFMYLTAHSDNALMREIMHTQPAGYINKPIKKVDLMANILRIAQSGLILDEGMANALSKQDKEIILQLHEYLQKNTHNKFEGLEFLSDKFGVSVSKLKANFKLLFGKPLYQYFVELQMKEALQILKKDKLKVKELAAKFGYESQGRFSEAFRKVNGILPSDI